jgi:hypothetical protein
LISEIALEPIRSLETSARRKKQVVELSEIEDGADVEA